MKKSLSYGLLLLAVGLMSVTGYIEPAAASNNELLQMAGPAAMGFGFAGAGMIFSEQLKFSTDQDISQVAGTYASTNIIDTGAPGTVFGAAAALNRNVGKGIPVPILVQLTEDIASAGASTLQIQIETASEEAMDTTNVVVAQSRLYTKAECVAGLQFGVAILPNDMQRYIRVNYIIGTATTTAGLVTAGIVHGVQTNDNQG